MNKYHLSEIAKHLAAELRGDPSCLIVGIAPLNRAEQGHISFLKGLEYQKYLADTKASAVIISPDDAKNFTGNALIVADPYLAYAKLTNLFVATTTENPEIHPTVIIGKNCNIDPSTSIGAYCVLGDNINIGAKTKIYPHVTLYSNVTIGQRAIIHSGAVVGSDGFGMANDRGKWCKIHHLGAVVIGDDVEIGANTTIDRGALDNTIIEDGVKLDNQIQVAHNVRIGAHTAIAGCTGIAGSTSIGKHCMIAGGVGIGGHLQIVDGVILTAMTGVAKSVTEPGVYSSGIPAAPHRAWWRIVARLMQLDTLAKKMHDLENKLSKTGVDSNERT